MTGSAALIRRQPTHAAKQKSGPTAVSSKKCPPTPEPLGEWNTNEWLCRIRNDPFLANNYLLAPGAKGRPMELLHDTLRAWLCSVNADPDLLPGKAQPDYARWTNDTGHVVRSFQKRERLSMHDSIVGVETLAYLDKFVGGPSSKDIPDPSECGVDPSSEPDDQAEPAQPLQCPILSDDYLFGPHEPPRNLPPWPSWQEHHGAKCQGACGVSCPDSCVDVPKLVLYITGNDGGSFTRCEYKNLLSCFTHQGCRDHDNCFDACEDANGESAIVGNCHNHCNMKCVDEWGLKVCKDWARGKRGSVNDGELLFAPRPRPQGKLVKRCFKDDKCYTSKGKPWSP